MTKPHTPGHIDYIEFPSQNSSTLRRTKEFFTAAFGWGFQDWGDDYADTAGSGIGSGINADPEHRPAQPLIVIYTDELDAIRARVLAAGGKIVRDTFTFPGGRRFHFQEPSGNVLAVWSDK